MKKNLLLSLFAIVFTSLFSGFSQAGFSCSTPIAITNLPYVTSDNTANYGDTYDVVQGAGCVTTTANYMSGNDVFYSYTPSTDGIININLTPTGTYSGIFVYDGCSNVGVSCLAGVANGNATLRQISSLNVIANHTYVIAISTWAAPQTVAYTLQIENVTCSIPAQVTLTSNVSSTSASFSWAASNNQNTTWEVYVTPCGTTAPTATTSATATSTSNFTFSNLIPNTCYNFYVRTVCSSADKSNWTNALPFTTPTAPIVNPVCGGTFIDNGGANGNYTSNQNSVYTICPQNTGDVVSVVFNSFDLEANYDALYVFNGDTVSSTQISSGNLAGNVPGGLAGGFWGTVIPGPFVANNTTGCLTFKFVSDSVTTKPGWNATVSCGAPATCQIPTALAANTIGFNSANVTWTGPTNANQWEVIVQPSTLAAPTATSTGTIATTNIFQASALTLGTAYKVYVRAICSDTDKSLWSSPITFTTLNCTPTTNYVSQITNTSAVVTWYNSIQQSATNGQWELIIQPVADSAPTAASIGIPVTSSPYTIVGLTCGTSYKTYMRSFCNNEWTSWSTGTTFTTSVCTLTSGQPTNLSVCSDNGNGCVTLTNNNAPILGNLDPALYTISYHLTLSDATNHFNALGALYCPFGTTQVIYALLVKNGTTEQQILQFTVSSNSINPTVALQNMVQCDDNLDGQVVFNLTNQIVSTNTVTYHLSSVDALNNLNPISNPTAYSIASPSGNFAIFAREIIANGCDNVYSFNLNAYSDCNLSYNCAQANSLCGTLGVPFANTHQGITADPGNAYGCLFSRPNPTWFYLPVSSNGTLNLTVEQNTSIAFNGQNLDVDYIVYGPFTNPTSACNGGLTADKIVSCSYSAAGIEYPIIPNAIAGQYYLIMTTNFSNQPGFIRITMNPSSQGTIDCSGVRMNAFLDANNNGTKDNGEQNFPLGQFHYTKNGGTPHNVTSPSGAYTIYDANGTNVYNLSYTIEPSYATMYAISTSSYSNVSVIVGSGVVNYYFPITAVQNYTDVAATIIPLNAPRAGFVYKNLIVYTNLGSQTIASGTLAFNNSVTTPITTISQTGTTPTATGFTYNYSNLLPFEVRTILVTMQVPPIPGVTLGQLITNNVTITPTQDDIVLLNNVNSSTQPVIASYDPNDKMEAHGEKIVYSTFAQNEYLHYTIRFENTGNASAINVSVKDMLDSKIDETSLQMVSASHNYTLDRVNNELTWNFNNIQLPVSVSNTDIGKGYVSFKVKLKPGFVVGDIIPNTANIYFDYNPAIVTNTFNTEFVTTLGLDSDQISDFVMYPNPAREFVQIRLQNNEMIENIKISDVLGKVVKYVGSVSDNQTTLSTSDLTSGIYIIEVVTANNSKISKKLVIK